MGRPTPQALNEKDRAYTGSTYGEIVEAIFANPYQKVWGAPGEPPLPRYDVTIGRLLRGALGFGPGIFRQAANRTLESKADLRWGPDGKGVRRLLHPNGVCVTGVWEITEDNEYSGFFRKGSRGLTVARISTHGTETTRGQSRSHSLVGKIFPTMNPDHQQPLAPANFICQADLGGTLADSIREVEIRNAPDVTGWNRGRGVPILGLTGAVFTLVDAENAVRQVYPIAELGMEGRATRTPRFMRLKVRDEQAPVDEDDLRDEILAFIFDRGDPTPKRKLVFEVGVADRGESSGLIFGGGLKWKIKDWQTIGTLTFDNAVASYNGDFVLHFHHPPWREKVDVPDSQVRVDGRRRLLGRSR